MTTPPENHDAAPGPGMPAYPGNSGAMPPNPAYPGAMPAYPGNPGQMPPYPAYPGAAAPYGAGYAPPGGFPPGGVGQVPYPGYPPPGGTGLAEPTPPGRPGSVLGAFWLWMAVAALTVISSIMLLSGDYSSMISDLLDDAGLSGSDIQTAAGVMDTVIVGSLVIGMIITLGLYTLFGILMLRGHGWARIVLAAWSGIQILSALIGLASGGSSVMSMSMPTGNTTITWINVALAVVAIVLVFLTPSNTFFTQSRAHRWARKAMYH